MRFLTTTMLAASAVALTAPAAAQNGNGPPPDRPRAGGGQGNAQGTPQRDPTMPRGLAAAFERGVPGILRAIIATQGSNSRLQDLPASP